MPGCEMVIAVHRDRNALASSSWASQLQTLSTSLPVVIDRSRQAFDAVKALLDADDGLRRALELDAALNGSGATSLTLYL
ncbi:MAG: hypothetical protein ACLU0O_01630 [Collinsella sp.]